MQHAATNKQPSGKEIAFLEIMLSQLRRSPRAWTNVRVTSCAFFSTLGENNEGLRSFRDISQTSLFTSFWRHVETTNQQDPLCKDECAESILKSFLEPSVETSLRSSPHLNVFVDMIAVRTRFFDDFLKQFLDNTISLNSNVQRQAQIISLGAGMDTRAYRMNFPSNNVVVYEIDQDSTAAYLKSKVLMDAGYKPTCPVVSVEADVQHISNVVLELKKKGLDTKLPSAWILEGLLAYIPPEEHSKIFEAIREVSVPGSVLILSCCLPLWAEWCRDNLENGCNLPYARLIEACEMCDKLQESGWNGSKIYCNHNLKFYGREFHPGVTFITATVP